MKFKVLFAAFAMLAAISCGDSSKEDAPDPRENTQYKGTVSVLYNSEIVENPDVFIDYIPSEDGTKVSLLFNKIRFVPAMPPIDVTVPEIDVTVSSDRLLLSCDNIVPLAAGGEFPRYLVTGMRGSVVGDQMEFSLNFGSYPTTFSGKKQ